MSASPFREINAVTLVTADMARSAAFYESLGFETAYRSDEFTTFRCGRSFLNVQLDPAWRPAEPVWGRAIIWVADVDAVHRRAVAAGHSPETEPADAPWGERYFHLRDPDGHELSFAKPLG
ncbi:VOC family protein [Piscicoccus intestinalis]|uniref:VOC family protein n=1 Tax=Piscicoccus intestinalis TaxID=746033 RepID=UPI000837EA56|nr:VOC family protein [Piscicoccus intestinalis]